MTPIYQFIKDSMIPIHYGTTKASLLHLTKYLANYLAKYKVRVNYKPWCFSIIKS